MKHEIRRWVMHTFNLVDKDDYERTWKRWRQTEEAYCALIAKFDDLTSNFTRTAKMLESAQDSQRKLLLELSIINVAPLETMDRALEILTVLRDTTGGTYGWGKDSPLCRAIEELQHGLDLMRKMPSQKGAFNGKYSHTAA